MPDWIACLWVFIFGGISAIASKLCNGFGLSIIKSITKNVEVDIPKKHLDFITNFFKKQTNANI